ncbi:OmpA family protein [Lysobacter gummosus]|uniref:OmpA family protein n=2 Tax=Lysobacter gummosus TaxID=262324 RepID=UPI00363EC15E
MAILSRPGRTAISLALLLSTLSCAARKETPKHSPPLLSGIELVAMEFKEGLPKANEDLQSALGDSKEFFLGALKRNARTMKKYPHIRFEVLGFTDDKECTDIQCRKLAARRAKLVHDWLISNGVPASSLMPPAEHGNSMPIDDNKTVAGRVRNRRVELNIAPD